MKKASPHPRSQRLRDYAEAVLGDSDLKVGPRAIALLLIETAEYLDRQAGLRRARVAIKKAKPSP